MMPKKKKNTKHDKKPAMTSGKNPLTIHAKECMHQRGISSQEVAECCENGESSLVSRKLENLSLGETSVIRNKKTHAVVTTFKTTRISLPCDPAVAEGLIKNGIVKNTQEGLPIMVDYKREKGHFELAGDEKNIARAQFRLENAIRSVEKELSAPSTGAVIRVPATRNLCGVIIGKQGANIKFIKKKLMVNDIHISWDHAAKEIVVTSKNSAVVDKLESMIAEIVRNHEKEERPTTKKNVAG